MGADSTEETALALRNKGLVHHLQGELSTAIRLYSRSIQVYPTAEAYTLRGWALSLQRRFRAAIRDCKKAIAIDPELGNPYNDIGSYLMILGKSDEAIDWLERAKKAPRYEPRHFPYLNLGRIYAEKGMLLKSIQEFETALQMCPGDPVCVNALNVLRRHLH